MTEPLDRAGLEALARIIDPVAERFAAAGHRLYLVGGVVRDLALTDPTGFDPTANDIDLTTDALPTEVKAILAPLAEATWSQGERFGTIGAIVDGHPLEITTHRAEAYDPESRKPVVSFGTDLGEDLSRRDFTINAAAVELPSHQLFDPYDGMADLAANTLRTPLSPDISFTDDPLRMLRAARFMARFELTPSPELVAAATSLADRLAIVSVERVAEEFERLIKVEDPGPGFRFLQLTGLLARLAPQLSIESASVEQRALAAHLASAGGGPDVRRAGLLWPIRATAQDALRHLRYSRAMSSVTSKLLDGVAQGLGLNRRTGAQWSAEPSLARRIVASIGADRLETITDLAANLGRYDPDVPADRVSGLIDMLRRLEAEEDLADFDSPLTGAQIMEILSIEPGPEIGAAQKHLRRHRLDHGPFDVDEAEEVLLMWWRQERDGGHSLR